MAQLHNQWNPPNLEWIRLNSDGACSNRGNDIKCGGVLRDQVGQWIQGLYAYTSKGRVFTTKLWGALNGLKLAQGIGYRKLQFEMDFVTTWELIEHGHTPTHSNQYLVATITNLLTRD